MNWLVTGGAGFVGSHLCRSLLKDGHSVLLMDNCSRPGSAQTFVELATMGATCINVNVTNADEVNRRFSRLPQLDVIVHLAGQVAVTTSVKRPVFDLYSNIVGTVNLLEAAKHQAKMPLFIFNSTNKVYGKLPNVDIEQDVSTKRYQPTNPKYMFGVDENEPLDFYSPYGCSKGAADQYVRDYQRIYGLPTVVLRFSCIAGTEQYGIEDQGWVAWLTIAAMLRKQVNIYGDGNQVRDVLNVDDAVDLYKRCAANVDRVAGKIFNVGGGFSNQMSVNELLLLLRKQHNKDFAVDYDDWRPGDQKWFCSYCHKLKNTIGWVPTVTNHKTVENLVAWVQQNEAKIRSILPESVLRA